MTQRTTDPGITQNSPTLPKSAVIIGFAILCLTWMLNAMDRQVFYPLLPQIREELGFSLEQAGILATGFTLGLAIAGFIAGFIIDRFTRKTVIIMSILVFSVGTGLIATSSGFYDMAAYRLISGVGEGIQATALYAIVGAYFFHKRAFASGFVGVAFGLGIFLGPLVGVPIATSMGTWRAPFLVFAALGLLMSLAVYFLLRKTMSEAMAGTNAAGIKHEYASVPQRILNRNTVVFGATSALSGLIFYGYLGLYPTFLTENLGFATGEASVAVAMGGLGAMLALLFGWFGDRFPQKWVLMAAFIGSGLTALPMYLVADSAASQYVLSFLLGAFASGGLFTNCATALQRSVQPDQVGRGQGIFVLTYYVAAAFSGLIFARLVTVFSWETAGVVQLVGLSVVGALIVAFADTRQMIRKAG